MTTRFKNAIDALVYAFFNDTLVKGTCTSCAIGNIIAGAMGERLNPKEVDSEWYEIYKDGLKNSDWKHAFVTHDNGFQQRWPEDVIPFASKKVIALTGYSIDELARVEYAFETNTEIWFDKHKCYSTQEVTEDHYNGLMAVVEVLCELEGIEDPAEYKELFTF